MYEYLITQMEGLVESIHKEAGKAPRHPSRELTAAEQLLMKAITHIVIANDIVGYSHENGPSNN